MKFSLTTLVVAMSMVAIVGSRAHSAGAFVIPPAELEQQLITKRSLCNTFGGCGAKRSMQQLAYNNGRQYDTSDGGAVMTDVKNAEPWSVKRRESKLELISEILNDLIEYLKTSEKYKHGKYIVMVSKPTADSAQIPDGLQLNALDVQQLQQSASRSPYATKEE